MNINPVNIDKIADYQNSIQTRFREAVSSKDEHGSMFTGFLGDGILAKMKETNPDSYKEYEKLQKEDPREIARFISKWAMRDALPQLSCWELMDKKEN